MFWIRLTLIPGRVVRVAYWTPVLAGAVLMTSGAITNAAALVMVGVGLVLAAFAFIGLLMLAISKA